MIKEPTDSLPPHEIMDVLDYDHILETDPIKFYKIMGKSANKLDFDSKLWKELYKNNPKTKIIYRGRGK